MFSVNGPLIRILGVVQGTVPSKLFCQHWTESTGPVILTPVFKSGNLVFNFFG